MNQKQLYDGLRRARKVYGTQSVHVNLVALQAGVSAGEIIDYLEENPTMAITRIVNPTAFGDKDEAYGGLYIDSVLAIPFLSTVSTIREEDNGATINVSISGDTFKSSTSTSNFTVDVGNTGLTFASCSGTGALKSLVFTGVAKTGVISIKAKNAGLGGSVDSDTVYINVEAMSLDISTINNLTPNLGTVVLAVASTGSIELAEGISLDFTAKTKGVAGDEITITLVNPETDTAEEVVEVDGNDITVTLAYDTNAIISTATSVKTKLDATAAAAALISTAITGEASTVCVAGDVTLDNGVDGTVASAGKQVIDGTKLWIATTNCTISNSGGWKFISYSS